MNETSTYKDLAPDFGGQNIDRFDRFGPDFTHKKNLPAGWPTPQDFSPTRHFRPLAQTLAKALIWNRNGETGSFHPIFALFT